MRASFGTGVQGIEGPPGSPATIYYNGAEQSAPKIYTGSTTTDSSGNFSFDISSIAFTTVFSYHLTVLSSGTASTDVAAATASTFNLTTISGTAWRIQGAVLGVLPITAVGSGRTVYLTVFGA